LTSVIIAFVLKLGELLIDKFISNKKAKEAMARWIEDLQAKGTGSAKLRSDYERLLDKYRESRKP
jgi:hypothetical protein